VVGDPGSPSRNQGETVKSRSGPDPAVGNTLLNRARQRALGNSNTAVVSPCSRTASRS